MKQVSRSVSKAAPTGGLNARDAIAAMPPTDAVTLDNFFPTPTSVNLRLGKKSFATGMTGNVETLANYSSSGASKLFAAANGAIYDVTSGGAVGAAAVSGNASNRWQSLNFGSTAANGQFLYLFNGVDYPLLYNGTQWQVVSGASAQTISSITNSGTTATVTTASAHGLTTGNFVAVSGVTPSAYNGTYRITVTSATTFTYTMASNPGGSATVVGSYLISPAITGVDPRLLVQATSFKQRIYMVEAGSTRCWYLPVNSIGGAAQSLDFGGMFKLGGSLQAVATWSVDNTAGLNEFFVAISSLGEVVVYSGYDPTNAANWTISSHFRIGRPIGRRCFVKVGSDLIFITADGAFPLKEAMLTDRSQESAALSQKIQNLINNDVQSYAANFGWDIILYPIGNKLIVNVPSVAGSISYQYVQNTITGAWCRFTGWNAFAWALYNDSLYYGGAGGVVYQADTGYSDDGAFIVGEVKTAFDYYGAPGQLKQFSMCRPVFYTAGRLTAGLRMDVDFADSLPTSQPTFSGAAGALWNTSKWNTFDWGTSSEIKKDWQGITGLGYAGALHMRIVNNKTPVRWQSYDVVYEIGGVL